MQDSSLTCDGDSRLLLDLQLLGGESGNDVVSHNQVKQASALLELGGGQVHVAPERLNGLHTTGAAAAAVVTVEASDR